MSQLVPTVEIGRPVIMAGNAIVEEEEEAEEADSWRCILAISSLICALLLVCGAIFLHIKERQQDLLAASNILMNTTASVALDSAKLEMPHNSTSYDEQADFLYGDDYYYNNNDNNNNNKNIDNNYDNGYDDADYYVDLSEDVEDKSIINTSSAAAKPTATAMATATATATATTATTTTTTITTTAVDSELGESVTRVGNDFRTRLNNDAQPQQSQQMPARNASDSDSDDNAAASTTAATNREVAADPVLSEVCLQCICEAATDCRPVECGPGVSCGLFRISLPYWVDAGRPTLQGVDNRNRNLTDHAAYIQCVNNPFCAARAIAGNMAKFRRDCNHDGKIDCRDYAKLHILGPTGCLRYDMPPIFTHRLERCMSKFAL